MKIFQSSILLAYVSIFFSCGSRQGRPEMAETVKPTSTMALIQGGWKYIVPNNGQKISAFTNIEMGNGPEPQLYNLKEDLGETKNLANGNPKKLKEMEVLFLKIKEEGRTRK